MVHADAALIPQDVTSKQQLYDHIESQLTSLLDGQRSWVTNLANASSVIYNSLNSFSAWKDKPVNWAGFYILSPFFPGSAAQVKRPTLLLGPFHGLPACQAILSVPGKGVCADASALLPPRTVVVQRTDDYPGHIACDSASQSEIVVPLIVPRSSLSPSYRTALESPSNDLEKTAWAGRGDADEIIVGVLDIDCTGPEGFDEVDKVGLERIARLVVKSCDW